MSDFLYHGSITPNIKVLEPRKRYTPGALGKDTLEAVYAGNDPFYCVAHALPWSSDEGFDLEFDEEGVCIFTVPENRKEFLNQKIYLYTVPADKFTLMPKVTPLGHNFRSFEKVEVVGVQTFNNCDEAAEKFGGKIIYK